MELEKEIFKKTIPNYNKLTKYGFVKENETYKYTKNIIDDLDLIITIKDNIVQTKIIDSSFNEEYINHKIENQTGTFVGLVREKYTTILKDIKDKCFITKNFTTNQANRINDLIFNKYKCTPNFKWNNNDYAVFENNSKWFGIIMNINKNVFSNKEENTDIINVKLDKNKIEKLLK